ncbi:hypothetical protein GWK47_045206 [Chionoecetes opilio]|uniref:Tesmin/TSO1-like CXC domain-containing protein n=1 Tax=Chionoecetes opilio TaxID=41210 RepID=A0A8J4YD44_CHIOP|nr:hypothetical protein GWK47_045206 [Chionoecetes opilio]
MHSTMDISIYQKFGTKTCTQYPDVDKIGRSQGQGVCDSLIGLHAFTGCDSRANFQAAIWRRCLEPKANVPSPSEHGWTEEDGKLNILWMRSAPAPEVVLELLACKCSRVCKLPDCACLVNGLTCTDMCKLQTCTNQAVQQQEPDLEPDSEDSENE